MNKLTLSDLWLVLDNIVRQRLHVLEQLSMGPLYVTRLRVLHTQIGGIPGVRDASRPLAKELASEDASHDAFARGIDHLLSAYEALEGHLDGEINGAVATIRKHVLPDSFSTRVSYVDEANAAKRRRPVLATIEGALDTLPMAGFGSCKALADRFTTHGEAIDDLIHKRSDIEVENSKMHARFRFDGISFLNDVRDSAELQLKAERGAGVSNLPEDIQGRLFGYANTLLQLRNSGNTSSLPDDAVLLSPLDPVPTDI